MKRPCQVDGREALAVVGYFIAALFVTLTTWGLVYLLAVLLALPAQPADFDPIPIPESAFPTPEEAADIARWIPAACCRTNRCCFQGHDVGADAAASR